MDRVLEENYQALQQRLRQMGRVAVAFSGGVDSTFLLKVAHDVLGENALALTALSPAVPEREQKRAADFCAAEGVRQLVYQADLLELDAFRDNPPDRCYHCKRTLFRNLIALAQGEGFVLVDGSNADDTKDDRPGMVALRELGVASPLLEAGLTKAEIRTLSRRLGLDTWDQPSAACLASRIPYGEAITAEKLALVAQAEAFLAGFGLGQLRVRLHGGNLARIEVAEAELETVLAHRAAIVQNLTALGCRYITLDLQGYRMGSLNQGGA